MKRLPPPTGPIRPRAAAPPVRKARARRRSYGLFVDSNLACAGSFRWAKAEWGRRTCAVAPPIILERLVVLKRLHQHLAEDPPPPACDRLLLREGADRGRCASCGNVVPVHHVDRDERGARSFVLDFADGAPLEPR